ncbi:MAG: hypothetical protein ABJO01_05930 [Parasphingorhabdus sp.]|uniref:hypothetical protein n=1 Tax=Parasphingorhabdus sp. TaxID=2709688 RepID=UPI00329A4C9E
MKNLSLVLAAASVIVATPALASGGGGGGGYSGGGFSAPQPRNPRLVAYNKGKRAFKKRITCKKCAYSSGVNNGKMAREVAAKVKAGEFKLKPKQRQAVLFYISERYSIAT